MFTEKGEVPDNYKEHILWSTCSTVSVPFIPLDEVTARAAQGRKHGLLNRELILCSYSIGLDIAKHESNFLMTTAE